MYEPQGVDDGVWHSLRLTLQKKNFSIKLQDQSLYLQNFGLHQFAFFAKPARDSNLELFNKLISVDLESSELTIRPILVAVPME